jgi:phosphoserine phosphatase
MSRNAPALEPTPAAPPEAVPGLTLEDLHAMAQRIAAAHGLSVAEVAEMIERVAGEPMPDDTQLLERLNARYAGARIVPARRPRR